MSAKAILVFCAQALFVQNVFGQCTSRAAVAAELGPIAPAGLVAPYGLAYDGLATPYGLAYDGLATPYGTAAAYEMAAPCAWAAPAMDLTPTSGGALPVTSLSAVAPTGIAVISENIYEGILAAAGELPFVGTVAVEGVLPTAGAGAINHACGNGINAMASETTAFVPAYEEIYAPAAAFAPVATIAPAAAIAPAAVIAPGLTAPALGYRAGWAGRGCNYAL